jgi:hypothetical protein
VRLAGRYDWIRKSATCPSKSEKKPITHRCSGKCATSEILRLFDISSTSIGSRLNTLLSFSDCRVCRLLYFCTELSHSVMRMASGTRSPSLVVVYVTLCNNLRKKGRVEEHT